MTRNLKATGLALICAFALGAIGAQSASAVVEHSYTSDSVTGSSIVTATTEPGTKEVFKLTNSKIECEDTTFRATVVAGSNDHIGVVPVFGGAACGGTGGAAILTNNGCTFTFDSDTFENPTHYGGSALHSNTSLSCGHTGNITVLTGGCTILIEDTHAGGVVANSNIPGVRFNSVPNHSGGKQAVTVEATLRTIKATSTGANCVLLGLGNPGTHTNATFEGKAIITGYEDIKSFNPHTETATEGSLVNLGVTSP